MAARTTKVRHDENTRAKIQSSQIINRLMKAFEGMITLDPTQVSIGIALLRKTLPDLAQIESHNVTEVTTIAPTPAAPEDWAARHAGGANPEETVQ